MSVQCATVPGVVDHDIKHSVRRGNPSPNQDLSALLLQQLWLGAAIFPRKQSSNARTRAAEVGIGHYSVVSSWHRGKTKLHWARYKSLVG
jgi:hypothetical protein